MKIHTIIQARTGSTRLPNKVNKMIGDQTLVHMVYERCCLATKTDRTIVAIHGDEGWPWMAEEYVEGPEEPAARFLKVLRAYPCDAFIRVCADSPFIDPQLIDSLARDFDPEMYDYSQRGSKHGNIAQIFSSKGFMLAEPSMIGDEREHLGLHYERRDRLTVDTEGDLERARLIVSRMTKHHTEYTPAECLSLLRSK